MFHWFSESESFKTGRAGWPDQGLPLMQVLPCPGESGAAARAPGGGGCSPGLSTAPADGALGAAAVPVTVLGSRELPGAHRWLIYTHYYIPIPISSIIPGLGHHFLSSLPLTLFSFSINHGLF